MTYLPHTDADRLEMLAAIGAEEVDDLFRDVPASSRFPQLKLPEPLSEMEIMAELQAMTEENLDTSHFSCFLGAGAYDHYVPRIVDHVISRSEFYTAYTPYQPEISQGTLQSVFEYQSMICALTGMDAANASHYDGATSTAEAVIMAISVHRGRRKKVIISPTVHPEYRSVVRTYTEGMGIEVVGDDAVVPMAHDGGTTLEGLVSLLDKDTACLIVHSPNIFGEVDDLEGLADKDHKV